MSFAGLYSRVSTKDQDLEVQKEKQLEFAKKQGHEVYCIYEEKISGWRGDRPELLRMIADAEAGKFSVLVVLRIDRLGRSFADLIDIVNRLDEAGVSVVSVSEGIDTRSKLGKYFLWILGIVAEMEREWIQDRLDAGRDYARVHGTKSGKPMHRPKKKLPMKDSRIKELYLGGMSMSELANSNSCNVSVIKSRLVEQKVEIRTYKKKS